MGARKVRRDDGQTNRRPAGRKVKRTITLSADASRRLDVHALGMALDVSQVVEQLVLANCRRYVLQDREGPPSSPGGGEGANP